MQGRITRSSSDPDERIMSRKVSKSGGGPNPQTTLQTRPPLLIPAAVTPVVERLLQVHCLCTVFLPILLSRLQSQALGTVQHVICIHGRHASCLRACKWPLHSHLVSMHANGHCRVTPGLVAGLARVCISESIA